VGVPYSQRRWQIAHTAMGDWRGSGMTTRGASQWTLHGVTRALVALVAVEAVYRVAIRSYVRQAVGIGS
jgi:hypothetical protein